MIWLEYAVLALLVTASAATLDFAHARYLVAPDRLRAGAWSVAGWLASTVGLFVAVRVSWWLLPFEPLGMFVGTYLGWTRASRREVDRS